MVEWGWVDAAELHPPHEHGTAPWNNNQSREEGDVSVWRGADGTVESWDG